MNMKAGIVAAVAACALAAEAVEVKKPSIMPNWSGAKVATWTMDYQAALASAKANGKCTILMFSGMWWCPHCQFLEENVLKTSGWMDYAQRRGFYEVVMDFPNRAGDGYWCWLWDSDFRAAAGLSAEDAAGEIVARYAVQTAYSVKGATKQTANNMVVEGTYGDAIMVPYAAKRTSKYTRVGYPTMIVLDPEGRELGRFTPVKSDEVYAADPLGWVKAKIDSIVPDPLIQIEDAGQYSGILLDAEGGLAGTVTCKASKPNRKTNLATLTFAFVSNAGKKTTVKTSVYSAESVTASVTDKSGSTLSFTLGADKIDGTYGGNQFHVFRDAFTEDVEAAAWLAQYQGNWSLVVTGSFRYEKGCSSCGTYEEGTAFGATLTVSIGSKGKTKVTGSTSVGTKVSVTAQVSYGMDGWGLLPVIDKKSGMAFALLVSPEGEVFIANAANDEKLTACGRPAESLSEPLYYSCRDTAAKLAVKGNKLTASDLALKFTYVPKTGVCKGSYKEDGASVTVNGVFVGATGYLFATPRGEDPSLAMISSTKPKNLPEDCDDCHE